jgi:hypothetical protein
VVGQIADMFSHGCSIRGAYPWCEGVICSAIDRGLSLQQVMADQKIQQVCQAEWRKRNPELAALQYQREHPTQVSWTDREHLLETTTGLPWYQRPALVAGAALGAGAVGLGVAVVARQLRRRR